MGIVLGSFAPFPVRPLSHLSKLKKNKIFQRFVDNFLILEFLKNYFCTIITTTLLRLLAVHEEGFEVLHTMFLDNRVFDVEVAVSSINCLY